MKLILASNSPRRKAFLTEYGFDYQVVSSAFEEKTSLKNPSEIVVDFAFGKAKEVFDRLSDNQVVVLGADTVVCLENKILGKPKTEQQAFEMLESLSNKTHQVYTGYAIVSKDKIIKDFCCTDVTFNSLTKKQIVDYIATGSPMDKAGAYGIQDGRDLVKEIKGSYNNVVGLPIEILQKQLKEILK